MDCCVFNNIESNLLFYVKIWAFELYVDVSAKEIVRQLGNENDGILTLSRNNSKFYMIVQDLYRSLYAFHLPQVISTVLG